MSVNEVRKKLICCYWISGHWWVIFKRSLSEGKQSESRGSLLKIKSWNKKKCVGLRFLLFRDRRGVFRPRSSTNRVRMFCIKHITLIEVEFTEWSLSEYFYNVLMVYYSNYSVLHHWCWFSILWGSQGLEPIPDVGGAVHPEPTASVSRGRNAETNNHLCLK